MKLTDFLQDVGRPVAYYPSLRRITGSTNATILLCQFIYWRGKESDPNGWLYKESDEIEQETGLSYGEQKTARRNLLEAGLIEEHYARLDHQMKFRLILEAINEKWGNEETVIPESGKPELGNDVKPLSLNESENTAENTTTKPDIFDMLEQNEAIAQQMRDSQIALESALGVNPWPWDSNATWRKFGKWVSVEYARDPQAFQDYKEWREGQGKFKGAMSNTRIRQDPQIFMDTGWPSFLAASSMYGNKSDKSFGL